MPKGKRIKRYKITIEGTSFQAKVEDGGAIAFANGATTSPSRTVSLAITKPRFATFILLAESNSFTGKNWIPKQRLS